jgi:hypothetical protein
MLKVAAATPEEQQIEAALQGWEEVPHLVEAALV